MMLPRTRRDFRIILENVKICFWKVCRRSQLEDKVSPRIVHDKPPPPPTRHFETFWSWNIYNIFVVGNNKHFTENRKTFYRAGFLFYFIFFGSHRNAFIYYILFFFTKKRLCRGGKTRGGDKCVSEKTVWPTDRPTGRVYYNTLLFFLHNTVI